MFLAHILLGILLILEAGGSTYYETSVGLYRDTRRYNDGTELFIFESVSSDVIKDVEVRQNSV
jgi:hypothetical protein